MNEVDAMYEGGVYSYSPPMELANDGRFYSVAFRCIVIGSRVAKSKSQGAKYVQHVAPSDRVLITSMIVRIRDKTILHGGEKIYSSPGPLLGHSFLPASYIYHDWVEDWSKGEDRTLSRRRTPPTCEKSEKAIMRKEEIDRARAFRGKALSLPHLVHDTWDYPEVHVCQLFPTKFVPCYATTVTGDVIKRKRVTQKKTLSLIHI